MTEQKIEAGEIVYDIGGRADIMYIVNKGCISMECEVEVEEGVLQTQTPSKDWLKIAKCRLVVQTDEFASP